MVSKGSRENVYEGEIPQLSIDGRQGQERGVFLSQYVQHAGREEVFSYLPSREEVERRAMKRDGKSGMALKSYDNIISERARFKYPLIKADDLLNWCFAALSYTTPTLSKTPCFSEGDSREDEETKISTPLPGRVWPGCSRQSPRWPTLRTTCARLLR